MVLRSEADFSDRALSRERRWLALFLLVHLVDEHGRMGAAYRRILRRAAGVPGHWAHGRSLGAVRAEMSRWIGVHARPDCMPPWDRIADLIHDAVHPRLALDVLATARYLHCLAAGGENDAESHRPHWLDPGIENITTVMIGGPDWARKHGLSTSEAEPLEARLPEARSPETQPDETQPDETQASETQPSDVQPSDVQPDDVQPDDAQPDDVQPQEVGPEEVEPPRTQPHVFQPPEPPPDESGSAEVERSAYQLLWSVVRVHREAEARIAELEHRVRELHAENARVSGDVTTWLGDYQPTIPDQERRTRSRKPVTDRHLALEDPAKAFTYPLPAELPATRHTAS